jgi:hypothetical protein
MENESNKDEIERKAKEAIEREEMEQEFRKRMRETPAPEDKIQEDENGYRSLGNVNDRRPDYEDEEGKRIERVRSSMGYIELKQENLPSKGLFYQDGLKILIRAATVKEVRAFSTVDEQNPLDVDEKLNDILLSCTKVELRGKRGSFKDILEEDRLYVILSVRELTFKDGENRLMLTPNKLDCKADDCPMQKKYELKTDTLQSYGMHEDVEKYYNEVEKLFVIPTKSSGTIRMAPPTIGVMRVITDFIKDKEEKKQSWDKAFLQIVPYIHREWRGFDEKALFDMEVQYQGWSMTKYTTMFRLAEKMRIGVKQEMVHGCDRCGAEVTVPVDFPGGVKSLFIVPDLDSELL